MLIIVGFSKLEQHPPPFINCLPIDKLGQYSEADMLLSMILELLYASEVTWKLSDITKLLPSLHRITAVRAQCYLITRWLAS